LDFGCFFVDYHQERNIEKIMKQMCRVFIEGEEREYESGTSYLKIAQDFKDRKKYDIVLVTVNGKLQELHKKLKEDCKIELITTEDDAGSRSYIRSVQQLMLKSIYDIVPKDQLEKVSVLFSLSKGYYCEIKGKITVDLDFLCKVKKRMLELVQEDIPFKKRSINTDDAILLFKGYRMYDKERLFRYRRASKVNLYSMGGFQDYYYGYMVPSTGCLKYFDLFPYDEGFVLQMPTRKAPEQVPLFQPQRKLFYVLKESKEWGRRQGISTVGDLNEKISQGKLNDIILVQEALQEQKISEIAGMIRDRKASKFVMIAGPSSSGKTTFSHRLSIQLLAHGLNPHPISVDDYFIDRLQCPRDESGRYDFESLRAIDVEQFNIDMTSLLKGDEIELPVYNFKTGKREYRGNCLKLGKEDILVIEGIHGLNDALSYSLPKESKFKIYISALTQLNIDEHNRIPSTDGRLIRRMVRDNRTRDINAKKTLEMWDSVRKGEEENIFPYQEEADVMFNSALIYELAALKQFAEPVLFQIDRGDPCYAEAKRLLKFLDYFLGITTEEIPTNSILREFVGKGCFPI